MITSVYLSNFIRIESICRGLEVIHGIDGCYLAKINSAIVVFLNLVRL